MASPMVMALAIGIGSPGAAGKIPRRFSIELDRSGGGRIDAAGDAFEADVGWARRKGKKVEEERESARQQSCQELASPRRPPRFCAPGAPNWRGNAGDRQVLLGRPTAAADG
jgi:hypothetical protein